MFRITGMNPSNADAPARVGLHQAPLAVAALLSVLELPPLSATQLQRRAKFDL